MVRLRRGWYNHEGTERRCAHVGLDGGAAAAKVVGNHVRWNFGSIYFGHQKTVSVRWQNPFVAEIFSGSLLKFFKKSTTKSLVRSIFYTNIFGDKSGQIF